MSTRAVFFDKDGTLVEDIPYNVNPQLIRPVEGALECLRILQHAGYQLVVVSNQSGVARGFFTEQELVPVERRLRALFSAAGVSLAGFYYCPHHVQGRVSQYAVQCSCRKPQPGMLYQAAREHHIDLAASWMIGDILDDVEAGNRAGCRTILVNYEHETEWDMAPWRRPDFMAKDLLDAAHMVTSMDEIIEWNFAHDIKKQ